MRHKVRSNPRLHFFVRQRSVVLLNYARLAAFRAADPGWQTRMNAALREWLKTHTPEFRSIRCPNAGCRRTKGKGSRLLDKMTNEKSGIRFTFMVLRIISFCPITCSCPDLVAT
ncbi:MAG: BrnA antitoxin family protein [Rhodocyclaceae bacterium]|nr:BrnA antitoxin family protein [Rhodocyclaceae bacterium]MBK6907957.1 BrnA antitoxin family protein [Rhodocyclaceae bacterium]